MTDKSAGEILALIIVDQNGGEMDARQLGLEIDRRLKLIDNEIAQDRGEDLLLDYCPICSSTLKNKKRLSRIVHDIVFHFDYYLAQTGN